MRAATKSRRHALALPSDRSTFLSASANSGPVQPFLPSGTKRATGVPFLEEHEGDVLITHTIYALRKIPRGLGDRDNLLFHKSDDWPG